MDSLAIHLVWSGALVAVSSHAAYTLIVIFGRPDMTTLVVPALLSLAGPATALAGYFLARNSRNGATRDYSHLRGPSLPEPEAGRKP